MKQVRSGFWTKVLWLVFFAHLTLGLARIPHGVVGKRLDEIGDYREGGPVRYLLDSKHHRGAEAVLWLLQNTPADSVVLWRGDPKGSFELVAHLIFPRLLYRADRLPSGATTVHDRPLASMVVVGHGDKLELQPR